MTVDYITTYDAADVHNWSGLGYYLANALESLDVPIHYTGVKMDRPGMFYKLKDKAYGLVGKKFQYNRDVDYIKRYTDKVSKQIDPRADVLLSPGSIPLALLETRKPKVFYTDATFAGMIGFYDAFSGLCRETVEAGNYLEQKALESATLAVYASDWAARTAIEHYNVPADKVKVVPFGANIRCDRTPEDIRRLAAARDTRECHLLFLGVDWERKGGDLALQTAELLNQRGLKTTLHVVGIKDLAPSKKRPFVKDYGFISKSTQEGRTTLDRLLSMAHFLILPTRAEAYGLVLCEACSFGTPCLVTDVGGTSTIVRDGLNGKTFPLEAGAGKYADYITEYLPAGDAYASLCASSFNEFSGRLNWDVAGRHLVKLLNEL